MKEGGDVPKEVGHVQAPWFYHVKVYNAQAGLEAQRNALSLTKHI